MWHRQFHSPTIWVETPFFAIEPGEDAATDPGRYGRAFARWLADQFAGASRGEERVQARVAEDWGWCLIMARKPYLLWIGCGNRDERTDHWCAFAAAEPCLWQYGVGTSEARSRVGRLHRLLNEILRGAPQAARVWSEDSP